MLHDLARTEIEKLRQHGVHALSYDEVAALQMAAVAVDEAVKSEGLPVGLPRPCASQMTSYCQGITLRLTLQSGENSLLCKPVGTVLKFTMPLIKSPRILHIRGRAGQTNALTK